MGAAAATLVGGEHGSVWINQNKMHQSKQKCCLMIIDNNAKVLKNLPKLFLVVESPQMVCSILLLARSGTINYVKLSCDSGGHRQTGVGILML